MVRKGFTLTGVLLGLFLLGLITVITLPILNSSLSNINKSKIKIEMNYIGEGTIEKIKSFNDGNLREAYIFDKKICEIIEEFKSGDKVEITLDKEEKGDSYRITISKEERSSRLWMIQVYVYHNVEGSNLSHVEYETYLLQK